jgi:hypothetical protein
VRFTETGDRPRSSLYNIQHAKENKISGRVDGPPGRRRVGIKIGSALTSGFSAGIRGLAWARWMSILSKEKIAVWIQLSFRAVMLLAPATGMYFRTRVKKHLLKLSMNDMRKKDG